MNTSARAIVVLLVLGLAAIGYLAGHSVKGQHCKRYMWQPATKTMQCVKWVKDTPTPTPSPNKAPKGK